MGNPSATSKPEAQAGLPFSALLALADSWKQHAKLLADHADNLAKKRDFGSATSSQAESEAFLACASGLEHEMWRHTILSPTLPQVRPLPPQSRLDWLWKT